MLISIPEPALLAIAYMDPIRHGLAIHPKPEWGPEFIWYQGIDVPELTVLETFANGSQKVEVVVTFVRRAQEIAVLWMEGMRDSSDPKAPILWAVSAIGYAMRWTLADGATEWHQQRLRHHGYVLVE
jgi:hypothetical protein